MGEKRDDWCKTRTLHEAIEYACEHLPKGWDLKIELELGYGGIVLENPECEEVNVDEFASESDDPVSTQFFNAVDYAVKSDHLFE